MRSIFILFPLLSLVDAVRVQNDNEIEEENMEQWGRPCPPGLEENATARACIYHGPMIHDPDAGMSHSWAGGSRHPLVFTEWGGLEDIGGELVQELQYMMRHEGYVRSLVQMVSVRRSHAAQHAGLIVGIEGFSEQLEADSENLAPLELVAEHAVEHLVLEGLEVGLHVLMSAVGTTGLAAVTVGGSLGVVEIAAGILGSHIFLGISAVHTAYQLGKHLQTKDARSREFATAMVAKSDCIVSKFAFHHATIFDVNNQFLNDQFFVPEIDSVCGADIETQLAEQMIKTNEAMMGLFQEFSGIGKCVFPEGSRSWSKSNCVAAIYDNLRSHEGEPGILYSSFVIAAAYGQESDEILTKKVYSEWFNSYFNITMPHSHDTRVDLVHLQQKGGSLEERASTCVALVALHRAFERTFVRLKTALNVFMHTFARETVHLSMRTTQHPCRRIFRKLEHRDLGLCKEGLDMPLRSPDTHWLRTHIEHLEDSVLEDDVETCIEDTHPELHLSIFANGPHEGENAEEEHEHRHE